MSIDTKSAERRNLRFNSIDDLRRDLDAIEQSHAAGTLKRSGNWTEGEIFTHLAAFINYGYEGYPKEVSPPWLLSVLFIRPKRARFLRDGMPAGVRIPGTQRGTIGMESVPFEEGLARFRASLDRLEKTPPPIESPAFGPMSYEDKTRLALRHAELHLGFLHP
jgi:hypothetical protein